MAGKTREPIALTPPLTFLQRPMSAFLSLAGRDTERRTEQGGTEALPPPLPCPVQTLGRPYRDTKGMCGFVDSILECFRPGGEAELPCSVCRPCACTCSPLEKRGATLLIC